MIDKTNMTTHHATFDSVHFFRARSHRGVGGSIPDFERCVDGVKDRAAESHHAETVEFADVRRSDISNSDRTLIRGGNHVRSETARSLRLTKDIFPAVTTIPSEHHSQGIMLRMTIVWKCATAQFSCKVR